MYLYASISFFHAESIPNTVSRHICGQRTIIKDGLYFTTNFKLQKEMSTSVTYISLSENHVFHMQ